MEWLDKVFWHNSVKAYLIFAGMVIAAWVGAWVVKVLVRRYVVRRADETKSKLDDLVACVGVGPISLIVFLLGLHTAIRSLVLNPEWGRFLSALFVVCWTVVGAVFLNRLLRGLLEHYLQRYADHSDEVLYGQMLGTLRSAVGVLIWAVALLFMVDNLGFNISSILAGLGLGGLALAMAAKDTLANVFGSFTILVNGPFRTGESVKYQGHEGTVVAVGLRDTRIRTWAGNLVTVPNSLAPTSVVENISRRPSFRVLFRLALVHDTAADKIDQACELIQETVRAEPGTGEKILTHLLALGESALELQVIYYIEDSARILDIQHVVNARIKQSLEKTRIRLAHQTFTVKK